MSRLGLAILILTHANAFAGNFHVVYGDYILRGQFLGYLQNVYNHYPERHLHDLIGEEVNQNTGDQNTSDEQVYRQVEAKLSEIKPLLSTLTFVLPSIKKEKSEIGSHLLALIGSHRREVNGYLEIGTAGRFTDEIKERFAFQGKDYLMNTRRPGFSLSEMIDRGSVFRPEHFILLNEFDAITPSSIPDQSVDVVANFVGLHSIPPAKRDAFLASIHRVLRPGGSFILREHDAIDPQTRALIMVGRDVMNLGNFVPWETNRMEVRLYQPLKAWIEVLEKAGFKQRGKPFYRDSDATRNALIELIRT